LEVSGFEIDGDHAIPVFTNGYEKHEIEKEIR
jgi:hypothetical protein